MDRLSKRGFTLIELLVVTAVIGVLAIVSATVFNTILSAQNKTAIINEVRQNGNIVIDRFDRDVKQSTSITQVGTQGVYLNTNSGVVEWRCVGSPNYTIQRDTANVINMDNISGVQLVASTCSFLVTGPPQAQIVKFDFELKERRDPATGKAQFEARVPFEVTVGTR